MALPEIGHTTTIGGERYELIRIEKVTVSSIILEMVRRPTKMDLDLGPNPTPADVEQVKARIRRTTRKATDPA